MWTDGRYYIQIEKELYPGWEMRKMERGQERLTQVVLNIVPKGGKIGIDYKLVANGKII